MMLMRLLMMAILMTGLTSCKETKPPVDNFCLLYQPFELTRAAKMEIIDTPAEKPRATNKRTYIERCK